jgi:hypothetical protein
MDPRERRRIRIEARLLAAAMLIVTVCTLARWIA